MKEHGAIFEISAKGVPITKDNIAFGNIPLIIDKLATKPSKKGAEAHIWYTPNACKLIDQEPSLRKFIL